MRTVHNYLISQYYNINITLKNTLSATVFSLNKANRTKTDQHQKIIAMPRLNRLEIVAEKKWKLMKLFFRSFQ